MSYPLYQVSYDELKQLKREALKWSLLDGNIVLEWK